MPVTTRILIRLARMISNLAESDAITDEAIWGSNVASKA